MRWGRLGAGVMLLLALAGQAIGADPPSEIRKGPYLIYPGEPARMQVLWQLDSSRTCTLAWGATGLYESGLTTTTEYGDDHQHAVTLDRLAPATQYQYRLSIGDAFTTGSFRSAPLPDSTNLKFLAYGDTRTNPDLHDLVNGAMVDAFTADPDFQTFTLHVGDFVSNGDSETAWTDEFFGRTRPHTLLMQANLPIMGCMGNHEESGAGFRKYFPYPFVAARYYSFDYGPAISWSSISTPITPRARHNMPGWRATSPQRTGPGDSLFCTSPAGRRWAAMTTTRPSRR